MGYPWFGAVAAVIRHAMRTLSSPRRAIAESCTGADAPEPQSFWNATVPLGTQPVSVPYLIVFDGSAGSSWFAECLDRHPRVFVAGYESLEWHGHPAYIGWNATEWQPGWLQDIWHPPSAIRSAAGPGGPAEATASATAEGAWAQWVKRYMRNEKLDPELHRSPLTVKMPQRAQLARAQAVGFKIRPGTITANHLSGTLRAALKAMGGRLLVVNRRNAVKQALSQAAYACQASPPPCSPKLPTHAKPALHPALPSCLHMPSQPSTLLS